MEKDSLLKHLPPTDKTCEEALRDMFNSTTFHAHLTEYQELQEAGEFDQRNDDYKQYLKGKRKRQERPLDPWKQKYYEEYWGQLQELKKQFEVDEELPVISYVQIAQEKGLPIGAPPTSSLNNGLPSDWTEIELEDMEYYGAEDSRSKRKKKDYDFIDYDEDEDDVSYKPKLKEKKERKRRGELGDELLELEDEEEKKPKKPRKKRSEESGSTSFKAVAREILEKEGKPLNAGEIVKRAIHLGKIPYIS
jgi:hypothetical protein